MSKYVKKRRAPPAEETWGNQGSVESFSGEEVDGPNNTRFVLHMDDSSLWKWQEHRRGGKVVGGTRGGRYFFSS